MPGEHPGPVYTDGLILFDRIVGKTNRGATLHVGVQVDNPEFDETEAASFISFGDGRSLRLSDDEHRQLAEKRPPQDVDLTSFVGRLAAKKFVEVEQRVLGEIEVRLSTIPVEI